MTIQLIGPKPCQRSLLAALFGATLLSIPNFANAQTTSLSSSSPAITPQLATPGLEQFWTSDRLRNARPIELHPKAGPDGLPEGAIKVAPSRVPAEGTTPQRQDGAPPSVKLDKGAERQLLPMNMQIAGLQEDENVTPEATSSFGAFFTTSTPSHSYCGI